MSKTRFVVNASRHSARPIKPMVMLFIAPMLVAVAVVDTDYKIVYLIGGLLMLAAVPISTIGKTRGREIEVVFSVNQLAVQLSTYRNGKITKDPVMIPRQCIIDAVVNEVILCHKVVSVLILRVLKIQPSESTDVVSKKPIQELLQDDNVRLHIAFPGVEMTYMECMAMRHEICQALGLY